MKDGYNVSEKKLVRFRYFEPYVVLPILIAGAGLGVIWIAESAKEANWRFVFAFSVFLILVIAGICSTLKSYADVVLDSKGISRKIFSITLARIDWTDIKYIKIYDRTANIKLSYARVRQEKVYCIDLYPCKPSRYFIYGGKIAMESKGNMLSGGSFYKILTSLNGYISTHGVKVESVLDGVVSYPDQLPTTDLFRV